MKFKLIPIRHLDCLLKMMIKRENLLNLIKK